MPAQSPGHWFRSTRFRVEPGEDAETNTGIHGQQLAAWIAAELRTRGHPEAEESPEDWGWAVVCSETPFRLFVACGNLVDFDGNASAPQPVDEILWHCYAAADRPFFAKIRNIDVAGPVAALDTLLADILRKNADILLVEAP